MEQNGFTKFVVPSCSFVLFRKPFHNEYKQKNLFNILFLMLKRFRYFRVNR